MEVLNYQEFKVTDEILASQGIRFLNYIIDRALFYLLFFLIAMIAGILFALIGFEDGIRWIENLENISKAWDYLITYSMMFLFYWGLESLLGKTIGKAITKTVVVLENGEKPSSKDIALRTLYRFVPFDAFSFLGTPSRGWHDRWSNTYVVKEEMLEIQKEQHKRFLELGEN